MSLSASYIHLTVFFGFIARCSQGVTGVRIAWFDNSVGFLEVTRFDRARSQ